MAGPFQWPKTASPPNAVRDTFLGEDMTTMKTATQYTYKLMKSPVGTLRLVGSDKGLAGVWF